MNLQLQVTSVDLHRHFHAFGAGVIEDVRVQRDKGFGFVRFSTHAEAAMAIQMGNARILCGKPLKVHKYEKFYTLYTGFSYLEMLLRLLLHFMLPKLNGGSKNLMKTKRLGQKTSFCVRGCIL